ncbi:MAG: hypothetical protein IT233_07820 [Bacteroidia bacterium]|nr:hypothetical protein [Bacteroidia bacterium]
MAKTSKKHKCPLCGSLLAEIKYYEIVGVWDAKAKAEQQIKKELATARQQTQKLAAEHKATMKKLEKEKRLAIKDGIEKGKQKEKSRADRLSKLVNKQSEDLQQATRKIKELEKHLKDGTTPQTAGHDFEREIVKQLEKEFPSDKIEHHGKGGDIFHRVFFKSKEIGSILYECKKTTKFLPDYVHQTKRAISSRNASYGVLITFATRKNAQGFFVDNDIIVVHPYGTIHIAQVLRNFLLGQHTLNLSQQQLEERSRNLMEFIKGDDFKNSMDNTIYRTQELAKILMQEHKDHMKSWGKRFQHYNGIHGNTSGLQIATKNILNGLPINKNLIKSEIKQLPSPEL